MATITDTLLQTVTTTAINPVLALLPAAMTSLPARVQLLAHGLQESHLSERVQRKGGPARGLWQFELGTRASRGGVWGVYLHDASRYWLEHLCQARGCEFEPRAIYLRIAEDDVLAAGLARLLIFTDRQRLPALGDVKGAWALYRRTWNPGKPRPEHWPVNYGRALEFARSQQ